MKVKTHKKRKYFRIWDLLVVGLVLVFAFLGVLFTFPSDDEGELVCEISFSGEIAETVCLSQVSSPYELSVEGKLPLVLEVCEDGVSIVRSDCPCGLCVNMGKITRSGQSIVCLPAQVSVRLISAEKPEFDAVVG